MKTYDCQTCGHLVLLEPSEVEEIGAYCLEHLFSEEFPALDHLADDVSEQEKRSDHPAKSSRTAHTETSTNEESSVMEQSTPWHPEWCSQVEDHANGTEVFHFSHAEVLERTPGRATTPDSGEGFRAEIKRCLNYESGPQYMDEWDVAGRLSIESEAFYEKVDLFLGPNKLRDLADFLFTEADRLDAWHEEQRARFAAGGDK